MSVYTASNGQKVEPSPAAGVGENVVNLAYDLVTLTELQVKLLSLDLRESGSQAWKPALAIAMCGCLALGAMPVLLTGFAGLLAEGTSLTVAGACLVVAGAALLISALGIWLAVSRIHQASRIMLRSQAEFQETVSWIKKVIQQSSASSSR